MSLLLLLIIAKMLIVRCQLDTTPGKQNIVAIKYTVSFPFYLRQGGYVFVVVCLFVSNFAQKLPNGFACNFGEGWQPAIEQTIKFWWRSGSRIRIRIRIRIATKI